MVMLKLEMKLSDILVLDGVLNITTVLDKRGVDNSIAQPHSQINSTVRKHEIGGVSIRRIRGWIKSNI